MLQPQANSLSKLTPWVSESRFLEHLLFQLPGPPCDISCHGKDSLYLRWNESVRYTFFDWLDHGLKGSEIGNSTWISIWSPLKWKQNLISLTSAAKSTISEGQNHQSLDHSTKPIVFFHFSYQPSGALWHLCPQAGTWTPHVAAW